MIENLGDAIIYSELSSDIDESLVSVPNLKEFDEYSNNELISIEKELYGFYLSNHPVTKYNNNVKLIDRAVIEKILAKFNFKIDMEALVIPHPGQ
jgi:DNA polymerase III alpha subunit